MGSRVGHDWVTFTSLHFTWYILSAVLGARHGLDRIPTSGARSIHSFSHIEHWCSGVSEGNKGAGPWASGSGPTVMKLESGQGPGNHVLYRLQPLRFQETGWPPPHFL